MTGPAVLTDARRGRASRARAPLVLGGLVLATTVALRLHDPHQQGSWGLCPFRLLTGWDCPGCGGLRAVNDLSNGDLAGAASSNLLLVASAPVLLLWWARTVRDRWQGRVRQVAARRHATLAVAFLVLALVFAVVRNLPFGAWLAP